MGRSTKRAHTNVERIRGKLAASISTIVLRYCGRNAPGGRSADGTAAHRGRGVGHHCRRRRPHYRVRLGSDNSFGYASDHRDLLAVSALVTTTTRTVSSISGVG